MAAALSADREAELHRALDAVVDIAIARLETLRAVGNVNVEETVFELGANRYGKSRIRLVTVRRDPDRHVLRDLTVDVALEGDFAAAHVDGDQANVIATDTMKNTVYAFARDRLTGAPESFGLELGRHFAAYPQVDRATVTLREHGWARIPLAGGPAPDAFTRTGEFTRVAVVAATKVGARGGGRDRGPDGHEDDEVRVQGLRARRVHDPGRYRRSDHGHEGDGGCGATARPRPSRASTSTARSSGPGAPS